MSVKTALERRRSVRAFIDREVKRETIERILSLARLAPSGGNTQPWQVAVVAGERKRRLQQEIEAAFLKGEPAKMDIQYYPKIWQSPYQERRRECALQLYQALDIRREDRKRRKAQWLANYRAFDAPVMLLFFVDAVMDTGAYLDYGMFIQSVMLMAVEEGLGTCPQASLGEYPSIVKRSLGYPEESVLICGMALGYEDPAAPINHYRTPRVASSEFTRFYMT